MLADNEPDNNRIIAGDNLKRVLQFANSRVSPKYDNTCHRRNAITANEIIATEIIRNGFMIV